MRRLRITLFIIISLVLLLAAANKVCERSPDYILFRNGVLPRDVILKTNNNTYYNGYIYRDKNSLKFIVIGKNNSSDYSYTVKQKEVLQMKDSYGFIYSDCPEVGSGGLPQSKGILVGYVNTVEIPKPEFLLAGIDIITPTLSTTSEDGSMLYFIHDAGYTLHGKTSVMLKVKSKDEK